MPKTTAVAKPAPVKTTLLSFPDPVPLPGHDNVELTTDGGLPTLGLPNRFQDRLDNLFAEWDALDEQVRLLKAEQATVAEELGSMLDSRKLKAVACDSLSVRWVYSHNTSINKLRLVENGVPSAVIAASTKVTPFRSLRVANPVKEAQRKAEKAAEAGENV